MNLRLLRKIIRGVLQEEIGRNFQTVHDGPISYKDYAEYESDVISTVDGGYILTVFYKDKKLTPTRSYNTKEEAELAARTTVEKHRVANVD